jgi:hypothetical protein
MPQVSGGPDGSKPTKPLYYMAQGEGYVTGGLKDAEREWGADQATMSCSNGTYAEALSHNILPRRLDAPLGRPS